MNAIIKPHPCPDCAVKDESIAQYEVSIQVAREVFAVYEAKVKALEAKVVEQAECIAQKQSMLVYADARIALHMRNGDRRSPAGSRANAPDRRQFRGQLSVDKLVNSPTAAALRGALDALEYVDRVAPTLVGHGVRAARMDEIRSILFTLEPQRAAA